MLLLPLGSGIICYVLEEFLKFYSYVYLHFVYVKFIGHNFEVPVHLNIL